MLSRQDITKKVEDTLRAYCQENIARAEKIGSGYKQLWQEIELYIAAGGKRIRPYLAYLAYAAYGGDNEEGGLSLATAWEFLHTCLLVHDDIIDRDLTRHHQLNIAGIYKEKYAELTKADPEHYALSAALLAGDLLLSATYEIIRRSTLTPEQRLQAQAHIHDALFLVGGGELLDVESVLYPVEASDPLAIAEYKTATYSFQMPMIAGASLAGATDEEITKLKAIGLEIGTAFQLKDDILGVFGTQQKTGKPNRSDIFEKKRTLLIQSALKRLSKEQATRLEELYCIDRIMSNEEAEEVVTLIEQSKARHEMEEIILSKTQTTKDLVGTLDIGDSYKAVFVELVNKLAVRQV